MSVVISDIKFNVQNGTEFQMGTTVSISYTSTITIDGVGHSPTSQIWTYHDGSSLGNRTDCEVLIKSEGANTILLTLNVPTSNGVITLMEEVKIYGIARKPYIKRFDSDYLIKRNPTNLYNLDANIFMSHFPMWSTARTNNMSNMYRFVSATTNGITGVLHDISRELEITHASQYAFGYSDEMWKYRIISKPSIVTSFGKQLEYIGEGNTARLEHFPVTGINTTEKQLTMQSVNVDKFQTVALSVGNKTTLYVSLREDISSVAEVMIIGVDGSGQYCREIVTLSNQLPTETYSQFTSISSVITTVDIKISTYCDLISETSSENRLALLPNMSDVKGQFVQPYAWFAGQYIKIDDASNRSRLLNMFAAKIIDKLFLSPMMDLIVLSDGKLYASKPHIDNSKKIPGYNSTANNNRYIYAGDQAYQIYEEAEFTINVGKLIEDFGAKTIAIKIQNGETIKYLDSSLQISNSETTLPIGSLSERVYVNLTISNDRPYVVSVYINGSTEPFIAHTTANVAQWNMIAENVQDIVLHNRQLSIKKDNKWFAASAIRHAYKIDGDHIYMQFNPQELKVQYGDINIRETR